MSIDLLGDEYLEEAETATALGRKVNTLRVWSVRRKGPPRIKVGRKVFYKKSSLKTYLDSQETHQPLLDGR